MAQNVVTVQPPFSLVRWIRQYPVAALVVLVFLFEWIVMVPTVASETGRLPFRIPLAVQLTLGWMPGLAAIIVTGAVSGRAGIRALLRRYLIWRVNIGWYLLAIFGTGFFILGGIAIHLLLGGTMPALALTENAPVASIVSFVVLLLFGVLLNTEDMAWRGVALPRMQARQGALVASLNMSVLFAATHLPYFFVPGDFRQQTGIWFFVFTAALTILMTWMYNNTRGSLLMVVLFHAATNAWSNLADTNPPPGPNDLTPFLWAVALMWALAIAAIVISGPKRLSRKPESEMPT